MTMDNYPSIVRFNFESSVITLTDKTRIQLCPDALSINKINFNLELKDSVNFYNALLLCTKVLLDIKPIYVEDKYNYELWKEDTLIASIAKTLKEEQNKPNHIREDLNVILQRKEDMTDRIFSQINFFNTHQSQIKKVKIDLQKHFQQYNPLIFGVYPDSLILEAVQYSGNYYIRYESHRSALLFNDLPEMGCSFIEFNYQFYDELKSKINILQLSQPNSLQIISSPWNEKDYMKRPATSTSRRRINFNLDATKLYTQAPLIEYLYDDDNNQYIRTANLNKVESFDFIHIIDNQFSKNKTITVKFISDPDKSGTKFYREDDFLVCEQEAEKLQTSYFKIYASSIKILIHFAHLIDAITISHIFNFFPVKLSMILGKDKINLIQQFFTSNYNEQLFHILLSYHTFKYNNNLKSKILEYIQDNQSVDRSEIQFSFKFNEEELSSAISDLLFSGKILIDDISKRLRYRDPFDFPLQEHSAGVLLSSDFVKLASAMSDLFKDYIMTKVEDGKYNYSVTGFQFDPNISLTLSGDIMAKKCNCGLETRNTPCYHIFALHLAVIKGDLL